MVHNGIVVESQNLFPKILTKRYDFFVSNYYYDCLEKKEEKTRFRKRPNVLGFDGWCCFCVCLVFGYMEVVAFLV